jgi:hypothetical protein
VKHLPLHHAIKSYLVCDDCMKEWAENPEETRSPQEMTKLDVGFTEHGLQVWCPKHEINIAHIDFGGKALNIDTRCLRPRSVKELN